MAIALPTEAGPSCHSGSVPVGALELHESPDSAHEPAAARPGLQTTLHVVDGVVYVVAGDDEWVLTPGDSATIGSGIHYRRWNAGEDEARWVEVYCASSI